MRKYAASMPHTSSPTNRRPVLHEPHDSSRNPSKARSRQHLPDPKTTYTTLSLSPNNETRILRHKPIVTFDTALSSPPPAAKIADDPLWDTHPPHPLPLIIRATDGKSQDRARNKNNEKVKLSTVVQPDELAGFYARYADVCKAGMQALKKRDRSKRKKAKKGKKGEAK